IGVTGVQTCALPISPSSVHPLSGDGSQDDGGSHLTSRVPGDGEVTAAFPGVGGSVRTGAQGNLCSGATPGWPRTSLHRSGTYSTHGDDGSEGSKLDAKSDSTSRQAPF